MANTKKVLIIGGHGKVGMLAAPKLTKNNHEVTSLIRNSDQVGDIEDTGATALLRDVTELSVDDWAELARDYDAVVWTAGNGGKGGEDVTHAVDRDAAKACVQGIEKLDAGKAPRFVMVSYVGSIHLTREKDDPMYAYTEAKKVVDKHLLDSDLEYVILGPAELTLEPAGGLEVIENKADGAAGNKTSRELVADVIVEVVGRETLPDDKIIPFIDGDDPVSSL